MLILNTATVLYGQKTSRKEGSRILLDHRDILKLAAYKPIPEISIAGTFRLLAGVLPAHLNNMSVDEKMDWAVIVARLMLSFCFIKIPDIAQQYMRDIIKVFQKQLPTNYNKLVHLSFMFLNQDELKEEPPESGLPKEVYSGFNDLIQKLKRPEFERIEKALNDILNYIFWKTWDNDGWMKIGSWVESYTELPLYKKEFLRRHFNDNVVIDYLYEVKQYLAIVKMYEDWAYEEMKKEIEQNHLFCLAYSYAEIEYDKKAKKLYEQYLQEHENSAPAYNNLGVLYEKEGNLEKALELFKRAYDIDSTDDIYKRNLKRIQDKIKEREKRPKLLRDRYFKTDKSHKRIMFSIYKLSDEGPVTEDRLQEVAGFGTKLPKLLKELMEKELVHWDEEKEYFLDPDIVETVKAWIDPQLQAQIIRHSKNKLYKPIFFHESEYRLYRVLVELFPQHLIFPNISLQSIIDYDKLKDHVESNVFEYYLKTHADFAVIDTTTYLPLIIFEKDSEYHDEGKILENTKKKNFIFEVAGLPLVRLRFNRNMDDARLKEEIKQVTKELLSQLMHSDNDEDRRILNQFDLKAFGIHRESLDLDAVHTVLKERLGEEIYRHIQEVNWQEEDCVLVLKVPTSFKPILELAWDKLKEELYHRFPIINRLEKVWV